MEKDFKNRLFIKDYITTSERLREPTRLEIDIMKMIAFPPRVPRIYKLIFGIKNHDNNRKKS